MFDNSALVAVSASATARNEHVASRSSALLHAWRYAALASITAVIVYWQFLLVGDFRVDDAYISFAFSKNLALGHGLIYGHDLRVEGYSNFLWVVICGVLGLFLPHAIYDGARIVSIFCFAGTLIFAFRIARLRTGFWLSSLVVLLLACTTDFTRAAQAGLETVPFTAALTLTVWLYLRESPGQRRASGYGVLTLSLLRIDGIVLAAVIVIYDLLRSVIERRLEARAQLRWLAPPALAYAAYFAWRYSYYGLLLPTTYYAKASLGIAARYQGLGYFWSAALDLGLPILLAGAAFACGRRLTSAKVLLLTLLLAQVIYTINVGGDWMPFNRFLLPVLPALTVLFAWGLDDLWDSLATFRARLVALPFMAGATLLLAILQDAHSVNTPPERDKLASAAQIAAHTQGLVRAHALYQWMLRGPGEKLVTDYGGVFAYFTDASVIEMWGLCNSQIALRGNTNGVNPIYGKTCVDCYKDFDPVYFHLMAPLERPVGSITRDTDFLTLLFQGAALDRVLDFRHNYVLGRVVNTTTQMAFYFLERRRPNVSLETRNPAPNIIVEYPFLG